MPHPRTLSRRRVITRLALAACLVPGILSRTVRAAAALLSPEDPQAKTLRYTEDARSEPTANGNRCATCALYQGPDGSAQGPCQIFPGKEVKAAGWCSSWAPQM
ncbi:MAG: high-potential iron-sulfur protein [Gammaproteobacteria bacterium]|nr:high-potential iron-sulfur protein [Gammaproteobacteria bacterium]MBV9695799.1 high-potential iron-sulfur protein [Gammaproteobacteria bacterium]